MLRESNDAVARLRQGAQVASKIIVDGVKASLVAAEISWESLQELQAHVMQRADQLTGEFQQQQWSLGLGSVLDMAAVEER